MKTGEIIGQGDVFLIKIDELPKNLKRKDNILALGEATGHHHRLVGENLQVYVDLTGKQFVDIQEQAVLEHEEHAHHQIQSGKYEVRIQREYDVVEGIRQVID